MKKCQTQPLEKEDIDFLADAIIREIEEERTWHREEQRQRIQADASLLAVIF